MVTFMQINTVLLIYQILSYNKSMNDCRTHTMAIIESTSEYGGIINTLNKFKKMMSTTLAGCMAASALMMSAGAVNAQDVPSAALANPQSISAFAGDNVTVNVVHVKADGSTTQTPVEVAIPEDTTNDEQGSIIVNAAVQASDSTGIMLQAASSAPNGPRLGASHTATVRTNVDGTQGVTLAEGLARNVDYSGLAVYMHDIDPSITKMNVSVWTSAMGQSNCYQLRRVVNTNSECTVLFYDDIKYGADNFIISPGDNITAFGSAVSGSGKVTTELYGIY